jgi:hypothetical protein
MFRLERVKPDTSEIMVWKLGKAKGTATVLSMRLPDETLAAVVPENERYTVIKENLLIEPNSITWELPKKQDVPQGWRTAG